jgi:ABC-2 type transport system permease protein
MYWSIRRELWENRSIYIAPLVIAGVVLVGFLIATIGRALAMVDPAQKYGVLAERNHFAASALLAAAFVIGVFYCLDALHGEPRSAASCSGSRCRFRISRQCSRRPAFRW